MVYPPLSDRVLSFLLSSLWVPDWLGVPIFNHPGPEAWDYEESGRIMTSSAGLPKPFERHIAEE
jgi:hypothetical protein